MVCTSFGFFIGVSSRLQEPYGILDIAWESMTKDMVDFLKPAPLPSDTWHLEPTFIAESIIESLASRRNYTAGISQAKNCRLPVLPALSTGIVWSCHVKIYANPGVFGYVPQWHLEAATPNNLFGFLVSHSFEASWWSFPMSNFFSWIMRCNAINATHH